MANQKPSHVPSQYFVTFIKEGDQLRDPQTERSMDDVQFRATSVELVTDGRMQVVYVSLADIEMIAQTATPGTKQGVAA